MENILKTVHLEYGDSAYFIDLVQHTSGKKYIKLTQKNLNTGINQSVKFRPEIIVQVANALYKSHPEHSEKTEQTNLFHNKETEQKVIKNYLKGLTIKEISLISGSSIKTIEQILYNNNIVITNQKFKSKFRRKKRGNS